MTAHTDVHRTVDPTAPAGRDHATAAIGVGAASGKTILFGEHSVVYGRPAIAVPVRALRATARVERRGSRTRIDSALYRGPLDRAPERLGVTSAAITETLAHLARRGLDTSIPLTVSITSDIPAERGLGSSAAVAAAVVTGVADAWGVQLAADEAHALIQAAEGRAHGTPSGLDARAVRAHGPIAFRGGSVEHLPLGADLHLVIADSGVRGRTRLAVAEVAVRRDRDRVGTDLLISRLGDLAESGREALALGDLALVGRAMDDAHETLDALGVGEPALDRLTSAARAAGAYGAKLTGGGMGGCIIALAPDGRDVVRIAAALTAAGATGVYPTVVPATRIAA